jgi:hypothetical protein
MDYVIAVLVVLAFGGFIAYKVKKSKDSGAKGGGRVSPPTETHEK